jgi:hypothetical protein
MPIASARMSYSNAFALVWVYSLIYSLMVIEAMCESSARLDPLQPKPGAAFRRFVAKIVNVFGHSKKKSKNNLCIKKFFLAHYQQIR